MKAPGGKVGPTGSQPQRGKRRRKGGSKRRVSEEQGEARKQKRKGGGVIVAGEYQGLVVGLAVAYNLLLVPVRQ